MSYQDKRLKTGTGASRCHLCGGKEFTLLATRIREGAGRILKCKECGLTVQDLNWTKEEIAGYYQGEYQITNSLVEGKAQSPQEHFNDRLKTIAPIFEKIRPLLKKESCVLEIGCGAGALLSKIKPLVSKCVGLELYGPFVDFIKKELGIEAYCSDVNESGFSGRFDLIISIATLDHLPNPLEALMKMKELLTPSGKIYLEVPNAEQALNLYLPGDNRDKFNEFFWHKAHFFYFNKETISMMFEKAGLKAEISCRHDYTLKNFLQWYFTGRPQTSFAEGVKETDFFPRGQTDFEARMNRMFSGMDVEFKEILADTFTGESLCCTGGM